MRQEIQLLALGGLSTLALAAGAQNIKPGLWEITTRMASASGEMEKAMADMQKQMAQMTPEQRKMMQDMMGKQGMAMGPGGNAVKVCISKEMAERNEAGGGQPGNCKQTSTPRSGNTMKFSYTCSNPPSSGEGQVTFVSPEAYSMKMNSSHMAGGKNEKMTIDSNGRFLSTDCGAIKPMAMPKQ